MKYTANKVMVLAAGNNGKSLLSILSQTGVAYVQFCIRSIHVIKYLPSCLSEFLHILAACFQRIAKTVLSPYHCSFTIQLLPWSSVIKKSILSCCLMFMIWFEPKLTFYFSFYWFFRCLRSFNFMCERCLFKMKLYFVISFECLCLIFWAKIRWSFKTLYLMQFLYGYIAIRPDLNFSYIYATKWSGFQHLLSVDVISSRSIFFFLLFTTPDAFFQMLTDTCFLTSDNSLWIIFNMI